jgi:hypothetical protein
MKDYNFFLSWLESFSSDAHVQNCNRPAKCSPQTCISTMKMYNTTYDYNKHILDFSQEDSEDMIFFYSNSNPSHALFFFRCSIVPFNKRRQIEHPNEQSIIRMHWNALIGCRLEIQIKYKNKDMNI